MAVPRSVPAVSSNSTATITIDTRLLAQTVFAVLQCVFCYLARFFDSRLSLEPLCLATLSAKGPFGYRKS
jgi:hypothetical protein